MGVRGLTTYVATYSDRYFVPHELKNCSLVIDGNSLLSLLYNWHSKCVSSFGGDYDKYAKCVSTFFLNLKKCKVTPLVIFDGGYESKKLRTVMNRLRKKISLAKHVSPTSRGQFFPLLLREVFKDVLVDLNIPFAQSLFEADDEIAAIARILNCPVLSYDSDFFVYDVMYIPFSTLHIDVSKRRNDSNKCTEFFFDCSIYHVENFLNHFGGLHKSLIPLMAALLGNDYISRHEFKNFFVNYLKMEKMPSISNTQKYIAALLHWLRTETLETATQTVLSTLKIKRRRLVRAKIKLTIKGYTQCSSDLWPYLGLSSSNNLLFATSDTNSLDLPGVQMESTCAYKLPGIVDQTETLDEECSDEAQSEDWEHDSTSSSVSSCTSKEGENELECDIAENDIEFQNVSSMPLSNTDPNLPLWFKNNFLSGHFPSYFMDMIMRNTYYCSPQVEDYNLPFAHEISFPIIYVIYGLLKTDSSTVSHVPLICYGRNSNHQPEKIQLTAERIRSPVLSSPLPSLSTLLDLPVLRRKSLLFDTLGFSHEDGEVLCTVPENWSIFIFAVVYWARHCTQPSISNCHILAILLCLLALNVVDKHSGYYRSKPAFLKALGCKLAQIKESRKNKKTGQFRHPGTKSRFLFDKNRPTSVSDFLAAVTQEECLLANEILMPFHQMNDRLKDHSKLYSVTTVHAFAQFQSCLHHIISLNSLLGFPFTHCKTAQFYSGIFIYNAYASLKKCVDVDAFIESILRCRSNVGLHCVCKSLYQLMQQLIPGLQIVRKKHKKSKTCRSKQSGSSENEEPETLLEENIDSKEESSYEDVNNKFSVLGQLTLTNAGSENSE